VGIKLIIAAYFALIAMVLVTGGVALSTHYIQASGLNALDNPHLAAPLKAPDSRCQGFFHSSNGEMPPSLA
jgi:hypothetical protein